MAIKIHKEPVSTLEDLLQSSLRVAVEQGATASLFFKQAHPESAAGKIYKKFTNNPYGVRYLTSQVLKILVAF